MNMDSIKRRRGNHMFNKEYKFTCERCGRTWFVSSKELREQKRLKKEINLMNATANMTKLRRLGIPTKKVQRQNAVLSAMKLAYSDLTRCPDCHSRKVIKSKA
jgi:hypothetical protein